MPQSLTFLAGKTAYSLIKEKGLTPDMVKVIAGAAGGPKWLVLNRLDRAIFTTWLTDRKEPLYLIGSSIGAWRFSVMSSRKPLETQKIFEEEYTNQTYKEKPNAQIVTQVTKKIIDSFLDDSTIDEILNHPYFRINFISVRSKWPNSSEKKTLLGLGLLGAYLANAVYRKSLGFFFERALFFHPKNPPPFFNTNEFPIQKIPLSRENYKSALLSTGSIPIVMQGVSDIPNAPQGVYRDGGIIDYHLDIPFLPDENAIVLYPHFTDRIIPGWLDKKLHWRKPAAENMKNVLLVAPSKEFIADLPDKKIPDRKDFNRYFQRDEDRIACWKTVIKKGEMMAEEFLETVSSGKIKEVIQPMQF